MQAVMETLFDTVYLISVITIGIIILRAAVLCVAAALSGAGTERPYGSCVRTGRSAHSAVPAAPESVAQRGSAPFLGHLPQYPLCAPGAFGDSPVLPQRKGTEGQGFPVDVADYRAEFWLLHPGGAVGGCRSHDWNADDSQDLRLCVDSADRIFCHETGMRTGEVSQKYFLKRCFRHKIESNGMEPVPWV